jgi:polyvinyl alcohol dehydrogenase (cytochrome)
MATAAVARAPAATTIGPTDWPSYGHDAQHSFAGVTSLTAAKAPLLQKAWFFPTANAVTANPIAVGPAVYVGTWDGYFYAINRANGRLIWKYRVKAQPAVPLDATSDGGMITSSAWFQPASGNRPDLVIFGGGYTLYALDASNGHLFWQHDYTGRPDLPPDPNHDSTRIFSSPAVVGDQVLVGVSSDGEDGHRGYVLSASLNTGEPTWEFQTDVNTAGVIQNDGCGGVWSSPSVDRVRSLVFFGVADCHFQGIPPYNERIVALHLDDGSLAWVFTPPRLQHVAPKRDPKCDFDFGTTVNLANPDPLTGAPTFLGVGGKDGTYYRLDPATGALQWARRVVFGGFAGGFLGTTADDGTHTYGATALGDLGAPCEPGNLADTPLQEPTLHAFNRDGTVAWQQIGSASYGPTTEAGGMLFVGLAVLPVIEVRASKTGSLLTVLPLPASCFCGITVAGNAVIFGTGRPGQSAPDGIYAYTPLGVAPTN